jgi:hypothetical protein
LEWKKTSRGRASGACPIAFERGVAPDRLDTSGVDYVAMRTEVDLGRFGKMWSRAKALRFDADSTHSRTSLPMVCQIVEVEAKRKVQFA